MHVSSTIHLELNLNNMVLHENQEKYLREKLEHLTRYAIRVGDESSRFRVELRSDKLKSRGNQILCEVTLFVPQAVIRAEVNASKFEEAIDLALTKLKKQISRYKSRWNNWDKRQERWIREMKLESEVPEPSEFGGFPKITKRKRYSTIQPMSEHEACEQMELVGHDFFMFLNADTDRLSVVYKREDSTYGLIEHGI